MTSKSEVESINLHDQSLGRGDAKRLTRRTIVSRLALAGFTLPSISALAQTWPSRPVRFVVPFGAGSAVDLGARLVAGRVAEKWGQSVIIENQPSGDTLVALTSFIRANDDHRLYYSSTGAFVMHPYLYDKMPYDPDTDFQPIARVSNTVVGIFVPATLNVSNFADLIAMARANPGKLNWTGSNNIADFVAAGYFKAAGLDVVQVPYREITLGAADLAEGRIQIGVMAYANVRPLMQSGRLKILAVVTDSRAPALPDTPTAIEVGAPGLTINGLAGLFGPKSLSPAARDAISNDVKTALTDPTITAQFVASGQAVNYGTPAEFATSIAAQRETAKSSAALGVKALR